MSEWVERAEDLEVFRRAYRLSLEVHRMSLEFPRIEQFALADQVRRASKSICANIAEGFGKAASVAFRIPSLCDDGDRFGRRDAGGGPCTAAISAISTRMWPSAGGASTGRSPGCSPACIAAVLISDF